MKKIVFLRLDLDAIGGAQRYLSRLVKALKDSGVECETRGFNGSKKLSSWIKALLFNSQAKRQKSADEIYFSLERITCADIYRAGDGVHKVYMKTKPFWFTNPLNFVIPYLEKRTFKNAKRIIANSNFIKRQICETYGIAEEKIAVVYNGVNLPMRVQKGSAKLALCEEFGLDFHLPTLLFVGSGFKRKGAEEFLRIAARLKTRVNCLIVGRDKNAARYKNLAKELGLNAVFTGAQKSTARFYEGSELFLFPTAYEPFSNVVLEALSYGCVAITTAQNGAAEILPEEFVMSSPQDYGICALIDEILNDDERLAMLQERNLALASEFSIEKNASATLEIIRANLD